MFSSPVIGALVIVLLLPYAWLVARIVGHGFFRAKYDYQQTMMRQFAKGGMVDGE